MKKSFWGLLFLSMMFSPYVGKACDAIEAPLASKSLLLDIVDTGEHLVNVGQFGIIMYADAIEQNWEQVRPVPTCQLLTSVVFPNRDIGYIAGHANVILKTTDGGRTWKTIFSKERDYDATPFFTIYFDDPLHGWAGGSFGNVITTTDGGETWKTVTLPKDEDGFSLDLHIYQIMRANDGFLYMVGESGLVLRIKDDYTIENISIDVDNHLRGMLSMGKNILVYGTNGSIFLLDGELWTPINTGVKHILNFGTILPSGHLLFAGTKGILLLTDRFFNVKILSNDKEVNFSSLATTSQGEIILVGSTGVTVFPSFDTFLNP